MILATARGDREVYSAQFDSSIPIPRASEWGGLLSHSGQRVGLKEAAGIPAFLRAVRILSETLAAMPLQVLKDGQPVQVPQTKLLRHPSEDVSRFDLWAYMAMSMICSGKAMAYKAKSSRRVEALYPLDPNHVRIKVEGGKLLFGLRRTPTSATIEWKTRDDILYIPGILLDHPLIGCGVVEVFRHPLGTSIARQEFEGRFLRNDAGVGMVFKKEGNSQPDERAQLRDGFAMRNSGTANAGRPAFVWNGWSLERLPISARDAQFVESSRLSVQDIARMTGVPSGLLGDADAPGGDSPEHENMRLHTYGLMPWMSRIEQGLLRDRDIFPDDSLTVEFDPRELLRPDLKTRMEAAHSARQAGIATANELRPDFGLGPHPDGDVLLATPVGGAPNIPSTKEQP